MNKLFKMGWPTMDADLQGQANKSAADAGSNEPDLTMNDLDGNEMKIHLDEEGDETSVSKDTQERNDSEAEQNDGIYPVEGNESLSLAALSYMTDRLDLTSDYHTLTSDISRGFDKASAMLTDLSTVLAISPVVRRYGVDPQLGEYLLNHSSIPGMTVMLPSMEALSYTKNMHIARQVAVAAEGMGSRIWDAIMRAIAYIRKKIGEFRAMLSRLAPVMRFEVSRYSRMYRERDQNEDIGLFNGTWSDGECYTKDYVCNFASTLDIKFNKLADHILKGTELDDDGILSELTEIRTRWINADTGKFTRNTLAQAGFKTMRDLADDKVYKGVVGCVDLFTGRLATLEKVLDNSLTEFASEIEKAKQTGVSQDVIDESTATLNLYKEIQNTVMACSVRCKQIITWYKNVLVKRS